MTSSICENFGCVLSLGFKKISASACVNSLSLITPCLGEISFLYAFPSCTAPNGSFPLKNLSKRLNKIKIPCAVSGLMYPTLSPLAPMEVLNIKL